jgi:carboxyl-terminal processing protease
MMFRFAGMSSGDVLIKDKRKKHNTFLSLILLILTGCVTLGRARSDESINEITTVISTVSYNTETNRKVPEANKVIQYLDPQGLFFLAIDLQLSDYSESLRPAIDIQKLGETFQHRLLVALDILEEMHTIKPNYLGDESFSLITLTPSQYAENNEELLARWRMVCKYKVLLGAFDEGFGPEVFPDREEELRIRVLELEESRIRELLSYPGGLEAYIQGVYLNVLMGSMDPHSSFVPWEEIKDVVSDQNIHTEGFGLILNTNSFGEIFVDDILPGSPAWKSGVLNIGDVVQSISFPSLSLPLLPDMEEINLAMRSKETTEIRLIVKKTNGLVLESSLERGAYSGDEGGITSFILDGEKKIGYVNLPSFYSRWESLESRGCANDVARKIIRLKKENIQGLILDLRNNSGGALIEAVELAGLFLDQGPVALQTSRDQNPVVLSDVERGMIYSGPLAVLVNGQSASASEIFARTIQNYNRGLVIGSPTFGKASGQIPLPFFRDKDNFEGPYDLAVVTTNLFYDLNGESHEITGLLPDIELPELFRDLYPREKDFDSAIIPEAIDFSVEYTPYTPFPLEELRALSQQRVQKAIWAENIGALNAEYKSTLTFNKIVNLNMIEFMRELEEDDRFFRSALNHIKNDSPPFEVTLTPDELEMLRMVPSEERQNLMVRTGILNDALLGESYQIICDLVNITN